MKIPRQILQQLQGFVVSSRWLSVYPHSMARLVSLGLLSLVLMLVVALALAGVYLERATTKGQKAVIFSTQAVQYSLALSDLTKDMERSARVYQVLGNDSLLASYSQFRSQLQITAKQLSGLDLPEAIKAQITALLTLEQDAFAIISTAKPGSEAASQAIESFTTIRDIARTLISVNSREVEIRVNEMKATARSTRQTLLWEGLAAILLVSAVAIFVIPPLARYIRELDQSILQIGRGNLDRKISLQGPKDIRDLGARLEWLRRQLLLLETQKQHFLRHFSHELKTPLASLREGACLLADGVAGPINQEQEEVCAILQRNCSSLQKNIEDLLKYSVSMQPFQAYDYQQIRLDEQITGVTREHNLHIRAKELIIKTNLEAVTILEDAGKITTVLDNLLSNAVKFSPLRGQIDIHLWQDSHRAIVEVTDQGPGIDEEEKERIFDAFYKVRNPENRDVEGSGLGLSIAKQYANAHGGDIEVIHYPHGARLRLTLPLQPKLQ